MNRRGEWLEADGLGGFASGTVSTIRTRRYHALLLSATTPPTGRIVLVNGLEAFVVTKGGAFALTSHLYPPGVRHPDGEERIESFTTDPWPRWSFRLEDGTRVSQQVTAWHERPLVAVSFALEDSSGPAELVLRPLLSGRDYHSLHHENPSLRFDAEVSAERVSWRPYAGLPGIHALTNGTYRHDPSWYRNFVYEQERERGLDFVEDLASPGELRFDLAKEEAVFIVSSDPSALGTERAKPTLGRIRREEKARRKTFPSSLHRAADSYIVRRGSGSTIAAGYPWFTDWGRDTFIALRGLCLSTGRLDVAEKILVEWAGAVSEGMLPNRFPDRGEAPEFNSVDASLWYVIAVEDFLARASVSSGTRKKLVDACQAILEGYSTGTRFGIRADDDGLLAAGAPGLQLTWMDAKVGDWVVTPRIGKPVEVQALWLNSLAFGSTFSSEWKTLLAKGAPSFEERFWYPEGGYLKDVVDVDHVRGTHDLSLRPNQIFAVGGLPRAVLLDERKSRSLVDTVEKRLFTPMGLRSLAPEDPRYVRRYLGGVLERDGSYHQGTVWPWLLGAFVEAWLRTGRGSKSEARARFLDPIAASSLGGHVPEIADAESPHAPRGCPFQAWSVGELLRALELVGKPARRKVPSRKSALARERRKAPSGPSPSL